MRVSVSTLSYLSLALASLLLSSAALYRTQHQPTSTTSLDNDWIRYGSWTLNRTLNIKYMFGVLWIRFTFWVYYRFYRGLYPVLKI